MNNNPNADDSEPVAAQKRPSFMESDDSYPSQSYLQSSSSAPKS